MARYPIEVGSTPRVCKCGVVIYTAESVIVDCEGEGTKRPGKIIRGFGRKHECSA